VRPFENPHNPEAHALAAGPEIVETFGGRMPDVFMAGGVRAAR
jgi:cysteine synthase